jgi:hypothetical protein
MRRMDLAEMRLGEVITDRRMPAIISYELSFPEDTLLPLRSGRWKRGMSQARTPTRRPTKPNGRCLEAIQKVVEA